MKTKCEVCNWETFEEIDENTIGHGLGFGDLQIQCDKKHENYSIAICNQPKSGYRLYYCPTCGRRLF